MNLKTILLLVSSISLLAGCNKASSDTKPTLVPDTNTGEVDTGITDTGSEDTTPSTDTNTDTGETTGTVTDKTYTTPEGFASSFNDRVNFDTEQNISSLKGAMDPDGKIISSIETEKVSIQNHALIEGGEVKDLTIGSSSYAGFLTINTSSSLKAISFTLQAYTKYVSYNSTNNIDNPMFQVNDFTQVTMTPGTATSSAPVVEYSYSFETPVSKVTIKNFDANQRVFIKSVTFTF